MMETGRTPEILMAHYSFWITHSPITLGNLSSINLVSIYRCSSPPRNPLIAWTQCRPGDDGCRSLNCNVVFHHTDTRIPVIRTQKHWYEPNGLGCHPNTMPLHKLEIRHMKFRTNTWNTLHPQTESLSRSSPRVRETAFGLLSRGKREEDGQFGRPGKYNDCALDSYSMSPCVPNIFCFKSWLSHTLYDHRSVPPTPSVSSSLVQTVFSSFLSDKKHIYEIYMKLLSIYMDLYEYKSTVSPSVVSKSSSVTSVTSQISLSSESPSSSSWSFCDSV
jgi:hypothetical protein